MPSIEDYIQFIDYHFSLLCRYCNTKSLDPDKIKGQKYLTCKCPKCEFDPTEISLNKFKKIKDKENAKRERSS